MSGLAVSREITVPDTGSGDFARTIDVFINSTDRTARQVALANRGMTPEDRPRFCNAWDWTTLRGVKE